MEVRPEQDASCFQRAFHCVCVTVVHPVSQTELLMNTHVVVSGLEHNVTSAHTMVRDIHRTIVGGQGGSGDNNSLVSDSQVS